MGLVNHTAAAVVLLASLSACGSPGAPDNHVVVFAAASLKQAFTEMGRQFMADEPGERVEFSFAGSADLLTQLANGAPADLFAPADATTMDKAAAAGLTEEQPTVFASNTLTIVVSPGNPRGITSLQSLTRPDLAVVVCAAQVPCGAATRKVEASAGIRLDPASEESQVTDVLTKVTSGQADAGLVYVTDAMTAGTTVTAVPFPESADARNTYSITVLKGSTAAASARAFRDFVLGADGQRILAAAGFGKP